MKVWRSEEWGGKFEDKVNWEVKNGRDIMFWTNKWVGIRVLKCRFLRLFSFSILKEGILFDCGEWVNSVWE